MSRRRFALVSLVAVLAVVLVACEQQEPEFIAEDQVAAEDRPDEGAPEGDEGAPEGDEGAPEGDEAAPAGDADETVTYVAVDNDYTDFPAEVSAGVIEFELVNEGNLDHDVTIEELGDQVIVLASGGETATGTVELEPGTYTVYCSIPGHRATMEEQLTVS